MDNEGGPLAAALQGEAANHRKVRGGQEPFVLSVAERASDQLVR
jgi:hypothetical protein